MGALLKRVSALLLSHGCLLIGNGLFMTLLSLRSNLEGFSTELTGIIMSGYFIGLFFGARYTGYLVDRVGYIRTFSVFASIISMIPLAHMLWTDPVFWFGLRLVSGFAMAGLLMVTESWLNAGVSNQHRGGLLAIYMIVNYLGAGGAQLFLLLQDPSGYQLFVMASICFSFCLVPVALTRTAEPQPDPPEPLKIMPTLRTTPVGFLGAACAGFLSASFNTMGPLFALQVELSAEQISWFMALGICGGLVLQTPIGKLSDRIERRKVIAVVAGLVVLICAAIALQVEFYLRPELLLASSFLYGSLAFTIYSLAAAHANDWAKPERRMQTAGALMVGYSIGAIAGPLLSSNGISWFGPQGLFGFMAVAAGVLSLFTLGRVSAQHYKRKRAKPQFVPRPGSYYTSGELYRAVQAESQPVPEETVADGADQAAAQTSDDAEPEASEKRPE
ncbi:MFS transporter [Aliamphritea spongicola]|uniref:MFS transporter n=1 Tax=Aliamphritea spongicola TaxID=707589 RepID=UPI00196AA8AC|nr:MFS transporter [Aliamphritea spongicola]MBN3561892.1 MFS transporter [Aliamphritea spongicola]